MRCINCGRRITRAAPGFAGAGFTICGSCLDALHAIRTGRLHSDADPTRARWALPFADIDNLDRLDEDTIAAQRGIVRDLVAPFNAFIEAATRRLDGDNHWRTVEVDRHRHCDIVVLPDGTPIRASTFSPDRAAHAQPDFGVYLDPAWQPTWPHLVLSWPDFGVPPDRHAFADACATALRLARAGSLVEIGCLGGHGRTGTMVAVLACMTGESADSAVAWTRRAYCHDAVETPEQAAFVADF